MENSSGGILGLGHLLMDVFGELPVARGVPAGEAEASHLSREAIEEILEKIDTTAFDGGSCRKRIGGGQALLAVAARALGFETRFLACVGADEEGDQVRSWLADYGVASEILIKEGHTGIFICIEGQGGAKRLFVDPGAAREIRGRWIERSFLKPGWVLAIDGLLIDSPDWLARTAVRARIAGMSIALDLSTPSNVAEHGAALRIFADRHCDFVFANEREFETLQGITGRIQSPRETWIVKLGSRGARSTRGAQTWYSETRPSDSGFDTGAGDFFAAGYLSGKLSGIGEDSCLALGNEVAASLVRKGEKSLPLEDLVSIGRTIHRW